MNKYNLDTTGEPPEIRETFDEFPVKEQETILSWLQRMYGRKTFRFSFLWLCFFVILGEISYYQPEIRRGGTLTRKNIEILL